MIHRFSTRLLTRASYDTLSRRFLRVGNLRTFTSDATTGPPVALIFDTETTDLVNFKKPYDDPSQPDLVQLGMILVDTVEWKKRLKVSLLIDGITSIGSQAQEVHGISNQDCQTFGVPLRTALQLFHDACAKADCIVAHNLKFDKTLVQSALYREQQTEALQLLEAIPHQICTMDTCTDILKLPGKFPGSYKWPSLEESCRHFTGADTIEDAHDALADAEACLTVFRALVESDMVQVEKRDKAGKGKSSSVKDEGAQANKPSSNNNAPSSSPTVVAEPGELKILPLDGDSFMVQGNTYKYKEPLKSLGAKWNPSKCAWVFHCPSQLEPARILVGEMVQ